MLAWWDQEQLYQRIQEAGAGRPLYLLHDGPPYANGRIHIGHALNKILKDIIVKSKTMSGYHAPYIPGWDCHGLPIEHQVTKELGSKKHTLTTIELRRKCREYAEKFYRIQREEFQRLGVLGDWEHPYLTMDRSYEATILREFGKFVEKGGVYKGLKPVLWCTVDQTALAEAEVEYDNHTSPSIYVKFPLVQTPSAVSEQLGIPLSPTVRTISIVIWTTTPWTLPANQAVCLHPTATYVLVQSGSDLFVVAEALFESFQQATKTILEPFDNDPQKVTGKMLEGLTCRRPLTEGASPVLVADFVTMEQGTGCVHIAPGHGMDDYQLALKYNAVKDEGLLTHPLEILVPVDSGGRFTEAVKEFAGQQVLKANSGILTLLEEKKVLLGNSQIEHSYPHCWRCKNPLIFRATEQWFVSMEEGALRSRALKEIDQVQWIPERGRDRIYGMIANRPDWCLSRQRLWGTPIPGFTCHSCGARMCNPTVVAHVADLVHEFGADVWFEKSAHELLPAGTTCQTCKGQEFEKEHDILDVWFESGVSHAAVIKRQSQSWWPADLYLEGSDQHRGWFHSALLTSVTTDERAPYKAVLTHGFVVDGDGKKMSKSSGNVVAPQDVMKQSGAEVLRLWVASQDYQEDLRISPDILKQLMEAYRKIRNTCRFLLSNIYDFDSSVNSVPYESLTEVDQWALMRLERVITKVRQAYDQFEFRQMVHEIDYFCAVDMSSTYLDVLKDRLYTFPKNSPSRRSSQTVMSEIVVALAKLMAPILSFTAEEIWQKLPHRVRQDVKAQSVHLAEFPVANPRWVNANLDRNWAYLLAVRTLVQGALERHRREKLIGSSLEAKVLLYAQAKQFNLLKSQYEQDLPALFIVSQVTLTEIPTLPEEGDSTSDASLGIAVEIGRADGQKCERCWNIRPAVGSHVQHPTLCDRCLEAIG